jgi:hypothetical protein
MNEAINVMNEFDTDEQEDIAFVGHQISNILEYARVTYCRE